MKPFEQRALKVIGVLLTSRNWPTALMALLFLLLLHWAATSSHHLIRHWLFELGWVAADWVLLLPFIVFLAILYRVSAHAALGNLHIHEARNPARCRVLVVFLSNLWSDTFAQQAAEFDSILKSGNAKDPKVREALGRKNSWRMPLEAMVYHLPVLEKLIVITSKESSSQLGSFKAAMQSAADTILTAEGVNREFDIVSIENLGEEFKIGINFESARQLEQALSRVYHHLSHQGCSESEVLVDITGGQKLTAAIGGAVTLSEYRRFQYVSTNNYDVMTYNVTHHLDPEPQG